MSRCLDLYYKPHNTFIFNSFHLYLSRLNFKIEFKKLI